MEPPIEYPKVFVIDFLTKGTLLKTMLSTTRQEFHNFTSQVSNPDLNRNLDEILGNIRKQYFHFVSTLTVPIETIDQLDDPRNNFITFQELDDQLDEIKDQAREGDILIIKEVVNAYHFYISGFKDNRKLYKFYVSSGPSFKLVLPVAALRGLRGYKISELRDIEKFYPDMDIGWIELFKYLLDKLSDNPFVSYDYSGNYRLSRVKFANKEDGTPLNIGGDSVIYVSANPIYKVM